MNETNQVRVYIMRTSWGETFVSQTQFETPQGYSAERYFLDLSLPGDGAGFTASDLTEILEPTPA